MTDLTTTIAVAADADAIWAALLDPATTPQYYLGFTAEIDPRPGAAYRYSAGGGAMITGTVVEAEEPRRLVTTFQGSWEPAVAALPESEVTFEVIEPFMPMPGVSFLRCTHRGLPSGPVADHLALGWVAILSGLKTLLETGAPMGRG